ncbi:hypothetical protein SGM_0117 [Streptomyces griseoaurantiacus M045]|uniref:Uncharacterized protein n=1 Tax=Streptomyces griseoaurantiacus M045 TaxID=996637 RepID=F3N9T3_9ACTN|nr:hypothetical protein SGM_0117 [Streptomyces griseoaurantiacus M045]
MEPDKGGSGTVERRGGRGRAAGRRPCRSGPVSGRWARRPARRGP